MEIDQIENFLKKENPQYEADEVRHTSAGGFLNKSLRIYEGTTKVGGFSLTTSLYGSQTSIDCWVFSACPHISNTDLNSVEEALTFIIKTWEASRESQREAKKNRETKPLI